MSTSEINQACNQAYEANSQNLGALYDGYMKAANGIGTLLFDAARLVRGVPYQEVRRGFQQTAGNLNAALDGTADSHTREAVDASNKAAMEMEKLPGFCEAVDHRLKDALDAVTELQKAIGAVQIQGFRTAHHLEKR